MTTTLPGRFRSAEDRAADAALCELYQLRGMLAMADAMSISISVGIDAPVPFWLTARGYEATEDDPDETIESDSFRDDGDEEEYPRFAVTPPSSAVSR